MNLSPTPVFKAFDNNGKPLVGGKLFTYVAGTSVKQATYTDSSGSQTNSNPIILDYRGEARVWLDPDLTYKFVLSDRDDSDPPTRPIWSVDNISGSATITQADFDALLAASPPYSRTVAEISAGVTPTNFLYEEGDLRRYGGVGDGSADDSIAWASAIAVGIAIIPKGFNFKVLTGAIKTGKVIIRNDGGTILSDITVLTCNGYTGSRVYGFEAYNVTPPWIITRDPASWASVPVPAQSNAAGYQPTINDADVWGSLTPEQQNQDIGPKLVFQGDSTDLYIRDVYGRFISILIYDSQESVIENCNFRAGKNFAGGIVFWNINSQVGRRNFARNIRISYSSYSSVVFSRNFDGMSEGIITYRNGESGVKFWKGVIGPTDARCYNMKVLGTQDIENYFDGPDLSSQLPPDNTIAGSHQISDIQTYGCAGTGMNIDGQNHSISNLKLWNNGRYGLWATGLTNSVMTGLRLITNNTAADAANHDLLLDGGNGNVISDVKVVASSSGQFAIYSPGTNIWANAEAVGRPAFFGNLGSITSTLINVGDNNNPGGNPLNSAISNIYQGNDEVGTQFWPRKSTMLVPSASNTGLVTIGTPGAEYGAHKTYVARNGVLVVAKTEFSDSGRNVPYCIDSAPNSAPATGNQMNGSVTFWLDEAGNNVKFQVKYAAGTVKTGTLAVV